MKHQLANRITDLLSVYFKKWVKNRVAPLFRQWWFRNAGFIPLRSLLPCVVIACGLQLLALPSFSGEADPASSITNVAVKALFNRKALLVVNGEQRLVAVGETFRGVTLQQADSRRAVIEINGQSQQLQLNQRIGGGYIKVQQPSMRIWADQRGMYRTTGTINGFAVSFLVDTGATSVAMNSGEAKRIGIDYRLRGTPTQISTASDVVTGYSIILPQVKVGQMTLSNIAAVVIEGDQPSEILLGMSYLGRLEISHQQGAMLLRQKF